MIDINSCININHSTVLYQNKATNNKNNLNIIYLNVQSIRNKLYDLEYFIKSFNTEIQVLVLTEIWINKSENPFFNLPGYTSFFSNRETSYGGVAIYVADYISSTQIFELEFQNSNFLIVKLLRENINIISIYRSQQTKINDFIEKLDNITNKFKNSIILGDFNINLLNKHNSDVISYTNTLLTNGYIIANRITEEFATRIGNNSKTIIDHFITDIIRYEYSIHITDTPLSDHQMFFIRSNMKMNRENVENSKTVLNYINLSNDPIWEQLESFTNFDEIVTRLETSVKSHTSVIRSNEKTKKHEWINKEIMNTIKVRDSFLKYKKKYPNDTHVSELYNKYKCKVKQMVLQAKIKFYSSEIAKSSQNSTKLWNTYKKIIFNRDNNNLNNKIELINYNNTTITNKEDIAECFNDYFINVTSTLNIHNNPFNQAYLNSTTTNIYSPFVLNHTNSSEVQDAICSLKVDSATGYDSISCKVIKQYANKLIPILVKFINTSFNTFTFPNSLKIAIVTPVYKKNNRTDPTNYRPISILNSFSKIFERIIKNRLDEFLYNNGILYPEQYGFEKNSNTTAACLSLTNFISKSMDDGKYTACLFIDFTKAFDCVDHNLLLIKLKHLNLTERQISFFKSYLENRVQKVKIGNVISNGKICNKGVPQGSILGPLLFKIYINDLSYIELKGSSQLFADDFIVKYSASTETEMKEMILHDLEKIHNWVSNNRVLINMNKTKILVFKNKIFNNLSFKFKNDVIEVVNNFNYLGLIIDSELKWTNHIDHICKKITPYIFILKRLRKFLDKKALYTIYNSYINSNILYMNPIWARSSLTSLNKLNILHKKSIKIINNYSILHPTNLLYTPQYPSLDIICKKEVYMLAFKIINNLIKHNFILNRNLEIHSYNTRNKANFYLALFKTQYQKKNCLYICLKSFNELPQNLKEIESLSQFKRNIVQFLLS